MVTLPLQDWRLNLEHSAQLQKALLMLSADKKAQGDDSSITMELDTFALGNSHGILPGLNGFTDTLLMVDHPVNMLVSATAPAEALRPLMSATGKRYMNSRARIQMGPLQAYHGGPVRDSNADTRLYQENWRNLESLIMSRSGKTDRASVQQDLARGRTLNALESLSYGDQGLVDAVVVGPDTVLTRPVLNRFYEVKGLQGPEQTRFNRHYKSLDEVVKWAKTESLLPTLEAFDPDSVTENPLPLYQSAVTKIKKQKVAPASPAAKKAEIPSPPSTPTKQDDLPAPAAESGAELRSSEEPVVSLKRDDEPPTAKPATETAKPTQEKPKFHFFTGDSKSHTWDTLPHSLKLKKRETLDRVELEQVPANLKSTLYRDSLYFPQSFNTDTGEGFFTHLKKLFSKRAQQQQEGIPTSNIAIIQNSPGGLIVVAEKIRSLIENGEAPVDVIVQGWGASCGSMLVSMVDPEKGNRFVTPNASILLHQARGSSGLDTSNAALESIRNMNYSNEGYMDLIADRSGRPLSEVEKDFTLDFWLNSVESILYGPKGLVDGILVGPNQVLTREAVMAAVVDRFDGDRQRAEQYIQDHFVTKRESKTPPYPEDHQEVEQDPLSNPLTLIDSLKRKRKAVAMEDHERFKRSKADVPGDPERTADWFTVLTP